MTAYILIREDQNDHGFVDTSVVGLFAARQVAEERLIACMNVARADNLRISDEIESEADWQVSWRIEQHELEWAGTFQ